MTPGTAELSVCSVLLATLENQSMHLPIKVGTDMRQEQKHSSTQEQGECLSVTNLQKRVDSRPSC